MWQKLTIILMSVFASVYAHIPDNTGNDFTDESNTTTGAATKTYSLSEKMAKSSPMFREEPANFQRTEISHIVSEEQTQQWGDAEIMLLKLDQQAQKIASKFKYEGDLGSIKLRMDIKRPEEVKIDYKYLF